MFFLCLMAKIKSICSTVNMQYLLSVTVQDVGMLVWCVTCLTFM